MIDKHFTTMRKLLFTLVLPLFLLGGSAAARRTTVVVEVPGTLPQLIPAADKYRIESLTLKGRLDGTDLRYLREMAGSDARMQPTPGRLTDVDLSGEAERFIANTLREGISNGIRHGGSTAFFFELKDMGHYVEFLLSDNGKGTDMHAFKEGFGLSGMRAKAEKLGGMVNFSSEEGEGFEIRMSLPEKLKNAAAKEAAHEN